MYQFYLNDILLPVAPESVSIKIKNKNQAVTLINEGEVNLLKRPGLSEIAFSALLPNGRYPFAQYDGGYKPAKYFLDKLETLKTGLKPFSFRLIRINGQSISAADSSFIVSLEDYAIHEDAGKYGADIVVDITLSQYEAYYTKVITFDTIGGQKVVSTSTPRVTPIGAGETTYRVKEGDSLWAIAKLKLGDGSRAPEVYNLNKDIIEIMAREHGRASSSGGLYLYANTTLRIPAV